MSEHPASHLCICGDHVWLPSTRGHVVLVSPEDAPLLAKPWNALLTGGVSHARRRARKERSGQTILLHKEILPPPAGMVVDHVNHNGMDNRRANLRLATFAQNQANRRATKGGTSQYKGVFLNGQNGRWSAKIIRKGVFKYLGSYSTEAEAAEAYDAAARLLDGAYACLNFPGPGEHGALRA